MRARGNDVLCILSKCGIQKDTRCCDLRQCFFVPCVAPSLVGASHSNATRWSLTSFTVLSCFHVCALPISWPLDSSHRRLGDLWMLDTGEEEGGREGGRVEVPVCLYHTSSNSSPMRALHSVGLLLVTDLVYSHRSCVSHTCCTALHCTRSLSSPPAMGCALSERVMGLVVSFLQCLEPAHVWALLTICIAVCVTTQCTVYSCALRSSGSHISVAPVCLPL